MYKPHPLDTDNVFLSADIMNIIEEISKNTHEVWATNRINEGWTFGIEYDGTLKKTPNLIPYEDLPESEKNYDRNTTEQVIKFLIKSGFEIKLKRR